MARPGDLERAWKAAGLTDVVQDMLTIRMDFASFEDFWAPIEGKDGPYAEYVCTLTPEAKAVFPSERISSISYQRSGSAGRSVT